jgi:hypothetical protein
MDESEIAAKLVNNIPKTEVESPEVKVDPTPTQPVDYGYADEIPMDDLTRYKMMDSFGVAPNYRDDPETISKLDYIYQWASELSNSRDYLMVMRAIRSAENALGYNPLKPRINRLYEFARLDKSRRKIEMEMEDV